MYIIKQIPEDFVVKERIKLSFNEQGAYSYFLLKKRNYTTEKAVLLIAKRLRIKRKYINYAGSKDKNAVTEQVISINADVNKGFRTEDLSLAFLGKGSERINLGSLEGNDFIITVRNLNKIFVIPKKLSFPNYFDEQRFSKSNVEIGRLIIKKRFREAVELISDTSFEFMDKMRDFIPKNDYVGALRTVPKRILSLYINSVQSLMFNNIVADYLKRKKHREAVYCEGTFVFPDDYTGIKNKKIQLAGFGTEIKDKLLEKELEKQQLTQRDFLIRQLPEVSSEGTERVMLVETNITGDFQEDEINKGKKKLILRFFIPKGSYATILIKALMP